MRKTEGQFSKYHNHSWPIAVLHQTNWQTQQKSLQEQAFLFNTLLFLKSLKAAICLKLYYLV